MDFTEMLRPGRALGNGAKKKQATDRNCRELSAVPERLCAGASGRCGCRPTMTIKRFPRRHTTDSDVAFAIRDCVAQDVAGGSRFASQA